ncbi:NADH dehydrogenase [ubiquinone] 1 beta subcomplex subunit 9 [Cylas formicarius]|uniref:NADH dehydrogenase [ubiquinone] 1 beta subcomplex subunit 9 n=1 Tax=Cylas formicarius TaxID=197179 RepID=UPI002958AA76|nr:NADH dehydrogenase [ubiquinone] 1 beta subcomplex subunit 9 [Cylas formicarius]
MANLPTGLVSHTRRVQSLYKRTLRTLEDWYDRREVYRYEATLMRKRFDDNRNITDMRVAKELINQGESELSKNAHYQPKKFPLSPGGVAYEREVIPPDWVVDYWHPIEKAEYPEYFARREKRKKEYVKLWEQQFGKSGGSGHQ